MKRNKIFQGMLLGSAMLLPLTPIMAAESTTNPTATTQAASAPQTAEATQKVAPETMVSVEEKALEMELMKLMPGTKPTSIAKTPVSGLYEVTYGPEIFYFNHNASLMIKGDMVDMKSRENLTERKRSSARAVLIEAMGEDNMIVYPAKDEKHKITVFTDIDCPYCVKLHQEMNDYHAKGITVRYMAYPRAGVGSRSYKKIVSVWCSDDRAKAMTDSKNGLEVEAKTCDNPVDRQFNLGQVIGVRGTPAIYLEDGRVIAGYMPASRLSMQLQKGAIK